MTKLYVDADACPVKAEAIRVGERYDVPVIMVSNAFFRLPESHVVERVVVPEGPDQADDWIAERATAGDLVVTADVPLASRCVKTGALVISPNGKPFAEAAMGMRLAVRDLNTQLREIGAIKESGPPFSKTDRSRFLNQLDPLMRRAIKISEDQKEA
ncbi:YaiI/YqxD family protein [Roseibium sp. CAU 1637]|uniref:UPF0178 protein J0X15_11085 n=1 Tax=Roseibium limicola TaxID=2816037 RepID=A0A939ENF4_9HYPH|nr:YaiI/YqxD family protein [Roseibium limicola]MBO0345764.1 YaiI/YqxD family protein [Roseibium limicola]